MKPYWTNGRVVLWQGHVLDCLAAMEAGSVQCAVTSPPYWGLRDYDLPSLEWPAVSYAPMAGVPPLDIPGCDPGCEHVWGEERVTTAGRNDNEPRPGKGIGQAANNDYAGKRDVSQGQYCQLCGGWRGSLGLEPDPAMFVGHIVLVARALWRVLRDDGTFWLNFGDSYATGAGKVGKCPGGGKQGENWQGLTTSPNRLPQKGLKPKDLIGIPWRVAFALQADGWYLRSDIIWAKGISFCPTYSGSCMPESVTDRPTKGHEYVFLLSKNKRYFYDGDAVRENTSMDSGFARQRIKNDGDKIRVRDASRHDSLSLPDYVDTGTRNLRSVWLINPGNFPGSHFATFPPALVEPMIKAGTSAKGCCPECGDPWVRVTTVSRPPPHVPDGKFLGNEPNTRYDPSVSGYLGTHDGKPTVTTTGWIPTCSCDAGEPVPCTVLDPFLGSGTTAEVADFLGRHSVGIELSEKYCLDHIIPRLTEPLFEWAAQEQQEPEPEIEQLGLL